MKVLILFLVFASLLTIVGINEVFADCNSPHCYAEWVNTGGLTAKGIKTDMQTSDIYAFPNNDCKTEIMVESIWMVFPDEAFIPQWIEVGVTTGGFTEGTSTTRECLTNKQAYMASSNANRLIGPDYQEFKLNRQIDSGDTVHLEILESYRDSNNVNYQPRVIDSGKEFHGESTNWPSLFIYPDNFKVGIESTVEPKKQYSSIPQVKFSNTQINLGAGYNDFITPGSVFAKVNINEGYKRFVCPDNSMIAGTVTVLDCDLFIGPNQRPTIQNPVNVINVESFRPNINSMTLDATDTDNEYVFFSISDTSSHKGTVVATIEPTGNLRNTTPNNAEFKFIPITGLGNDIVTFKVTDGRVGHDKEIQYHFVQAASGLPDSIDDLSGTISSGRVTLHWSQPQSDSIFRDVEINSKLNGGSWREVCNFTRSSETSCVVNVGQGFTYDFRVKIKNTVGWSEWSNITQIYSPDRTPPSLNFKLPTSESIITTDKVTVSGTAFDVDSGIARVLISLDGQSQIQALGTNQWTWTFIGLSENTHTLDVTVYNGDELQTSSPTRFFTVSFPDVEPPVITIPPNKTFEATALLTPLNYTHYGMATATDNKDPNPIITNDAPDSFHLGDTEITWFASDHSGNSHFVKQSITIVDTIPPVIIPPANITVQATGTQTLVNIGDFTATDIFPVTINNNSPDLFPIGDTIITYTATDSNGNTSTITQTITVEGKTPITFTIQWMNNEILDITFNQDVTPYLKRSDFTVSSGEILGFYTWYDTDARLTFLILDIPENQTLTVTYVGDNLDIGDYRLYNGEYLITPPNPGINP